MGHKLGLLTTICGVVLWATQVMGEGSRSDQDLPVQLLVHGIHSDGRVFTPFVRHEVQRTGGDAIEYVPKGAQEIEVRLYRYRPDHPDPALKTLPPLRYATNQARDQALESMAPLGYAARYSLEHPQEFVGKPFSPQIIAPTLPGKGEHSWQNNEQVLERWLHVLPIRENNITLHVLADSQAGPQMLKVLQNPQNHGLVTTLTSMDAAFGSVWAAVRQTQLKWLPENPLMPNISDALKDNALPKKGPGSQALQQVLGGVAQNDPQTKYIFLNFQSGVVSQDHLKDVVSRLQQSGKTVTHVADPRVLYTSAALQQGFGPGTNKGLFQVSQAPELTGRWPGPHGAGTILKYANFDTLVQGMQIPGVSDGLGRRGPRGERVPSLGTPGFKVDSMPGLTGNWRPARPDDLFKAGQQYNDLMRGQRQYNDLMRGNLRKGW